jgi:cytolysin (calcineurin-like family phosphatase)
MVFAGLGCRSNRTGNWQAKHEAPTTFFMMSDTHYGINDSVDRINRHIIDEMNSLPGKKYTSDTVNFTVNVPAGVIISGDLTDKGDEKNWQLFAETMKVDGTGALRYPVYEGFGNHDGPVDGIVRNGIKQRNFKRKNIIAVSKDSLHYSFRMGNIHMVNLNLYPGNKWVDTCDWCKYFKESFREPQFSLDFLKEDLAKNVGNSNQPVILHFHYGFDEWSFKWWTRPEQDAFYEVIRKYNIAAILFGHSHVYLKDNWRGIPVICAGSSQKNNKPGEFLVVQVEGKKLYVAVREPGVWKDVSVIPLQ